MVPSRCCVCCWPRGQAPPAAQTGAASITGLITDESGAPVPGVTITATNQATNVTYNAVSNEAGNYTIAALPIGTYVVKAELTGFRTLTRTPTTFEAQQIARLDFRMSVGQIQESVEVSGTPPILQTETATVGEVISGNTAQSLPLNGRNIGQLALTAARDRDLQPARLHQHRQRQHEPAVRQRQPRTDQQLHRRRPRRQRVDRQPGRLPADSRRRRRDQRRDQQLRCRHGQRRRRRREQRDQVRQNQLRGSVFEFYRNSDFDANTWENNFASAPKQERKQHIYGGTIGGPLVRNSLFFFADYQGSRQDAPGFGTASVAPAAWRAANCRAVGGDHRSAVRPAVPR